MNKARKLINKIGIFSLIGAIIVILGIGLYNLSQHKITGSDRKNIERNIQSISENEEKAKEMLYKIYKAFEAFKAKNNRFPYNVEEIDTMQIFLAYPRIPNTTVRKIGGYLFNVSSFGDFWFCYAWPEEYGITGRKSYYIDNDSPKIKWTERKFSGIKNPAKDKDAGYWRY